MSDEAAVTDAPEVESPSAEETPADVPESPSEQPSDETKATETESPSAKAAEEDAEPEEWKNLVKKYGGDKEKAGKAYWKAVNDNAQLAKENKELKAKWEAAEKAKSEPAQPHPTLKQVDDYITALTKDVEKTLPNQEAKHYQEYQAALKAVHELEYELKQAEKEEDKLSIRTLTAEVKLARTELKQAERDVLNTQDTAQKTRYEIERMGRYRKQVEQQIEAEAKAKQEQEGNLAEFMETFPDEIDGYVTHFADEFKIPADEREDVKTTVYEHLISRCKGNHEDADQDWKGMVKDRIAKEAKRIERAGRSHFAQVSKEKKAVTTTVVAKPAPKADEKKPHYQVDDGRDPKMKAAAERLAKLGL